MKGVLFLAAFAALPLVGYPFIRAFRIARPNRASEAAVATAAGAVAICGEMLLLSWVRVPWSLALLLAPPAGCLVTVLVRTSRGLVSRRPAGPPLAASAAAFVVLFTVAYAAATARATSADLMLFWASKGQKFAQARAVDVAFLGAPEHHLMHPDYPPMLPCLDAFAATISGRFSWGGALVTLPFFLALGGLAFYGHARTALGARAAAEWTLVLLALFGFLLVATGCAGNADPPLLAFEVLALSAIAFAGDGARTAAAVVGIALAAAVLTKVEGTVFAALALAAWIAFSPPGVRARILAAAGTLPVLALAAWVVFTRTHGLADVYDFRTGSRLGFRYLPEVLRGTGESAAYGVGYAPWIAVGALMLGARFGRRSLVPLAVAAGFGSFILYLYLSAGTDPSLFIRWSAGRLLITPLACLFVAAAAASAPAPGRIVNI